MTQSKHEEGAPRRTGRPRFRRAGIATRIGVSVALVASMSGIIAPAAAMASETSLTVSPVQTQDDAAFESDISKSTTIQVFGTEGNMYLGEPLDPITITDSANLDDDGNPKNLEKSLERDPGDWGFYAYVVEYSNNTNPGVAAYSITGGKDAGAVSWASDYSGTITGTFEIAKGDLAKAESVELGEGEKGAYLANGTVYKPAIKVSLGKLTKKVQWDMVTAPVYLPESDYTVVYRDAAGNEVAEPKEAGTYTAEAVAASDNVEGVSPKVTFEILAEPVSIADAQFFHQEEVGFYEYEAKPGIQGQTATGQPIEPDFSVKIGEEELVKDVDYTVSYADNTNVGTATVTITGIGIYAGTASQTFEITPRDISGLSLSLPTAAQGNVLPYTGEAIEPATELRLQDGGHYDDNWNYVYDVDIALTEGVDYTVEYANNTDVWEGDWDPSAVGGYKAKEGYDNEKMPRLTVTGIGNFTGTIVQGFNIIVPDKGINAATVNLSNTYTFNGSPQNVSMKDTWGSLPLSGPSAYNLPLSSTEGVYYTVKYTDDAGNEIDKGSIVDAGTYHMVLTGKNGLKGEKDVPVVVSPADFSAVAVPQIPDQTLKIDGSMPTPVPEITCTFGTGRTAKTYALEAGKDFDVAYEYPEAGDTVASMTITPKGNFAGDPVVRLFNIVEAAEPQIVAPVTWTSPDGRDWTRAMGAATTDGKVAIEENEDGTYNVTLTPSNAMVAGIQYPVGTDIAAVDGSYTLTFDNLMEAHEIFVSVPMSPTKGYDGFMTIDLSKAGYAMEQDTQYATQITWQRENGSDSMIESKGYIPTANLVKTAEGYKAVLQPAEEAASLLTSVNGSTEQPFVIDVADPAQRTAVTFTVGAMPMAQTAYMVFDDMAKMADLAAVQEVAALIAALPEDPAADPAAVKAAQEALAALTEDQQDLMPESLAASLDEAVKAVEAAEKAAKEAEQAAEQEKKDQAAADAVIAAIAKAAKSGTEADVAAARAAYDKLTAAQKAKVPAASVTALQGAEKKIADAKKAAASAAKQVKKGQAVKVAGQTYRVTKVATAKKAGAVTLAKARNAKKVSVPATVKLADGKAYKVTKVAAKAFSGKKVRTVTVGKNVAKIAKGAFRNSKATKVVVKSAKLAKKSSVKGAFSGSKVKTVQVKAGSKKLNAKLAKKYAKSFAKKNTGTKAAKLTVK